jgi:hypothetical protein
MGAISVRLSAAGRRKERRVFTIYSTPSEDALRLTHVLGEYA